MYAKLLIGAKLTNWVRVIICILNKKLEEKRKELEKKTNKNKTRK